MEADALLKIDWEKCDEIILADSIQAIVAAAIAGNVANYIEAIPHSPKTIDSILPSIHGTPIISKAITSSSRQSHLTCLESESSIMKTISKPDDSICSEISTDHQLNLKFMTEVDCVETQSNDKTIHEIIQLFKTKELQC